MQVNAGQQNAGHIVWVKTIGHGPTGFRLTAVHAKHEEGRSADGAVAMFTCYELTPLTNQWVSKAVLAPFIEAIMKLYFISRLTLYA